MNAQSTYTPAPENLEARKWFQDAKFGMFIHWGLYSLLSDGEWVMNNRKIPVKDYERLTTFFNPVDFNPAEWVALAKAAGMKYITITSKHHDGFALYDSKVSDYDIVDRTHYKKDILKMLAEECQKQGIKLFFYHSHLDWHHPDYFPTGMTGAGLGRPESGDFNKYLDYMDAQLTELLTNYGPIGGIWFDGWWDQKTKGRETKIDWRLGKTYSLIHKLQPAALIGNNHHVLPFAGEDFQMFEKDLPGQNTSGFSEDQQVGQLPLEMCETMNGAWGFNINDRHYKSTRQLVQLLVNNAGHNANLLLNIGPMPSGKIQPEFMKTLQEMGEWTKANGETIYGTRGGPIPPRDWGVTTQKGNKIYVHILNWKDKTLALPSVDKKIKSAMLFSDKSKVVFSQKADALILTLPKIDENAHDTIVELEW
ncbi:alpha-L-fucosidase [Cytophagaceae bacterium YF14B1]|uniref:alpha-L-fucosidase n=1 Tax=Xanthocytophaga flava TaxID=3048013 RepID=A0AAE3U5R7_9BACT|nr:alpha-L-fucosidase [Xanthocytophaga flavus]MDJ1481079.1 alpha-L-fucosidase [Xanthocytophaga flavus]